MSHRDLDRLFACFCRDGDLEALAAVFRIAAPALLRRARRRLGDAAAAEDVVQELFLSLLQGGARCDGERSSLPFLLGALHRHVDKWLRRRRDDPRDAVAVAVVSEHDDPALLTIAREQRQRVHAAIAALPHSYRDVVADYLERQLTPTEIARRTQQRGGTVRVQIHRGLALLRRALPGVPLLALLALGNRAAAAAPVATTTARRLPWRRIAFAATAFASLASLSWLAGTGSPRSVAAAATVAPIAVAATANDGTPPPVPTARAAVAAPLPALRVVVTGANGEPLPAVGVRAWPAGTDADFALACGATDGNGEWRWPALLPGEWIVQIDRDQRQRIAVATTPVEVAFRAAAGAVVRGIVRDRNGEPVAGAAIWVSHRPRHPWDGQVVVHSRDDGTFALRDMPAMTTVAALARGHVASSAQPVGPRSQRFMELRLDGGGARLRGTVCDRDGPVAGALVHIGRKPRAAYSIAGGEQFASIRPDLPRRTAPDGTFVADDLPPGPLEVLVRAPGHRDAILPLELRAGEESTASIAMERGIDLHGAVTDADGLPVADAVVLARGLSPRRWSAAECGADGAFALCGLDPARIELSVEADGYGSRSVVVADPTQPVAIELRRLPRLCGVLCTADGTPVDAAEWELGVRDGAPTALAQPMLLPLDADARFSARAPDPDAVRFSARRVDTAIWHRCTVERRQDDWRLLLPADCDELATIRLVRSGFSSEQLLDFQLFLQRDEDVYVIAAEQPEPTFTLPPLPVGTWHLHVYGARGACPAIDLGELQLDGKGIERTVEPPPCGWLRWNIAAEETPVDQFRAFLVDAAGHEVPLPRAAGRMALPAGEWRLWATSLVFGPVRGHRFAIAVGAETALDLRLPRGHIRQLAFWLPPDTDASRCRARLRRGDEVLIGDDREPGAEGNAADCAFDCADKGFDCGADGFCTIVVPLADGHYRLDIATPRGELGAAFDVAGPGSDAEPRVLELARVNPCAAARR